jgi:hypothetical protein
LNCSTWAIRNKTCSLSQHSNEPDIELCRLFDGEVARLSLALNPADIAARTPEQIGGVDARVVTHLLARLSKSH